MRRFSTALYWGDIPRQCRAIFTPKLPESSARPETRMQFPFILPFDIRQQEFRKGSRGGGELYLPRAPTRSGNGAHRRSRVSCPVINQRLLLSMPIHFVRLLLAWRDRNGHAASRRHWADSILTIPSRSLQGGRVRSRSVGRPAYLGSSNSSPLLLPLLQDS